MRRYRIRSRDSECMPNSLRGIVQIYAYIYGDKCDGGVMDQLSHTFYRRSFCSNNRIKSYDKNLANNTLS